jgi:Zn-dependent protease with chaperone function
MLVPLTVSSAIALLVTSVHRRLPPVLAARITMVALLVVAAAATPTVWITSLGFLAHAPTVDSLLGWCTEAFGTHEPVGPVFGIPASGLTAVGLWQAMRTVVRYRRLRRSDSAVVVTQDNRPFAYTLPGRGGYIVISSGLQRLLSTAEESIVLAHEHAHARHRHDRYLLVGQLAAALLVPIRPLVRTLEFSLERWADESAVSACGDRRLVARTLGRVALHRAAAQPVIAFAGLGVAARMRALLAPPVRVPGRSVQTAFWLAIAVAAGFASLQAIHLGEMLLELCRG